MAVAVLPAAAIVAVFAYEVLDLWTGNMSVAQNGHLVLTLLIAGNALNAMLNVPYWLQVAAGRVSLVMMLNLLAALLMAPLTVLLCIRYGASGGAGAWLVVNFVYVLGGTFLMHRRMLRGELLRWYRSDFIPPAFASLAVAGIAAALMPSGLSKLAELAWMAGAFAGALVAALLVTSDLRTRILTVIAPGLGR
jgi:O-antigen/teichoic acid export membrane protein